jgi:hypothetical protein
MSRVGEIGDIKIHPRVTIQQARQTIKSLIDAIVELLTNSDDSYRRLEQQGTKPDGWIEIAVLRQRGGKWKYLLVSDHAEGMNLDELLAALEYGGITSGFERGISVRGLWGRGLKETILALGKGSIQSVKDGRKCEVEIWWDSEAGKPLRKILKDDEPSSTRNGTTVKVFAADDTELRAPKFETLYDQISQHYALRDIVQVRAVWLIMEGSPNVRSSITRRLKRIKFNYPPGDLVLCEKLNTPFGWAELKVWEAMSPLRFARYDPCSLAGILVKTEGATLDLSLFGLEGEEASHYFFGELWCPGIANAIREKSEDILTTTRRGLDWRHKDCRDLETLICSKLKPLIEAKKRALSSVPTLTIPHEKKFGLMKLLNKIAQEEIEGGEGEGPGPRPTELDKLTIRPDTGYGKPGEPRRFSVYLPRKLAPSREEIKVAVKLDIRQGEVSLDNYFVPLEEHPKWENLLWGSFQVIGQKVGDRAYIECQVNGQQDIAEFIVGDHPTRSKVRPAGGRGGFIQDIQIDDTPDPDQRTAYIQGRVLIYRKFPGVLEILKDWPDTPQGKVLFAELVLEAFCRAVARRRIDDGSVQFAPGGEIDGFASEVNRLIKKCMLLVHKWVAEHY